MSVIVESGNGRGGKRRIVGLTTFAPEKSLTLVLKHKDGSKEEISVNHTYNAQQIEWFKAGGALNMMRA